MVQINWGLAQGPNNFQNALAQGYQMGSAIRQREDEKQYKNALATVFQGGGTPQGGAQQIPGGGGLVATPEQQAESDRLTRKFGVEGVTVDDRTGTVYGPDGQKYNQALSVIAQQNPQLYMQLQQREEARLAQEAAQRQEQMGTIRRLLAKAGQSPEGWQQAMGAAQSLGIDTSAIPQQYDPEWAKQQLFIMDALERDKEAIPGIAREVMFALGTNDPSDPRVQAGVREVLNNKYASDYVDAQGNTRRRTTLDIGGQSGSASAVQEGATATNPQTGEKIIFRNGSWQPLGGTGMPATLTQDQYRVTVERMGKAATDAWMQRNGIRIGN